MEGIITPRFQLNLMVDDRDKRQKVYNLNKTNKIILNPSYLHRSTQDTNSAQEPAKGNPSYLLELSKLKRGNLMLMGTNSMDPEKTFSQPRIQSNMCGENIHMRSEMSITLGSYSNIVKILKEKEPAPCCQNIAGAQRPELDEVTVQNIIKDVLKVKLQGLSYNHENCKYQSAALSLEIHDRLKTTCQEDTYKIAVNVVLGEIRDDGIESATQCVWNPQSDCIVCGYYKNTSLIAIATVFASYSL